MVLNLYEKARRQLPEPIKGRLGVVKTMLMSTHLSQPIRDIVKSRYDFGMDKYGKPLETFDGRDTEVEIIQELADALIYTNKGIMEGRGTKYRLMYNQLTELIKFFVDDGTIEHRNNILTVLFPDKTIPDFDMNNQSQWYPVEVREGDTVAVGIDNDLYRVKEVTIFEWGIEANITAINPHIEDIEDEENGE